MEDQTHIGIFIGFGCLAMISLSLLIFNFFSLYKKRILEKETKMHIMEQEKKIAIFKSATEAEEKQKEKIAKNLHDGIIPALSVIGRSLEKITKDYESESGFDVNRIKKDMLALDEIVENIRGVSHDLIPNNLLSLGLIKALAYYMEKISDTGDSLADFENKTSFDEKIPFSMPDQLNIYRICLEILNNLYKHAGYKYLKVSIDCVNNSLEIDFVHNGKGITNKEVELYSNSPTGLGLKSLKSRALFLNANINYTVETDTAFINLSIPFKT